MANKLPLPTHCGSMFAWTGKVGVIDASDFPGAPAGRVYRDACDEGFVVRSPVTGREKVFVFERCVRNREGEVVADVYRATDGSGVEVHILND